MTATIVEGPTFFEMTGSATANSWQIVLNPDKVVRANLITDYNLKIEINDGKLTNNNQYFTLLVVVSQVDIPPPAPAADTTGTAQPITIQDAASPEA